MIIKMRGGSVMALQSSSIDDMNTFLNKTFLIPDYQREYSWENDELDDFWNDLQATMKEEDEIHFFGQVVVHEDVNLRKKFIIDGQQRTTSSMVFLRTLQNFFAELANLGITQADYKRSDIESIYLGREGERHLTLGEADNDYFEQSILKKKPSELTKKEKKKSHERLRNAYLFFDGKITELLADCDDEDEKFALLQELYETFIRRFKVLYMEATQIEEAFVIFETLNARGRDLETADLLKNYILNQSGDIDGSLKKWNSMIDKLDKCDTTKYIRTFWNTTHSFTREKALYRVISKNVSSPRKTKEFMKSLDDMALVYHDIVIPNENTVFDDSIKVIFSSLKMLKAKTFYPVFLAMKMQSNFTDADMLKVAEKIECYVFRNFTICGKTANSAETYFSEIAKDIFEEKLSTSDSICDEIKKGIVSDDEFHDSFQRWSGTKSNKDAIRYIFRKIHKYLDSTNEINVDNMEVHIEHIMPEDNSIWQIDEEVHDSYLWRLGNLCLLSRAINESIKNKQFSIKKAEYKDSKIEPNKKLLDYSTWDDSTIESRQSELAGYAVNIWPR